MRGESNPSVTNSPPCAVSGYRDSLPSHLLEPEWRFERGLVAYDVALARMEDRVEQIARGEAPEHLWMLEHPPLYSLGTSGNPEDIHQNPHDLPVYKTGRGGQATYHGPGQRIAYVMLHLKNRRLSPRVFTATLEKWIQAVLEEELGVETFTDPKRIGLWVKRRWETGEEERKVASVGVRIRQGVSYHGFALNVSPELRYFHAITPCGLPQYKATSLEELGLSLSACDVDTLFQKSFGRFF